MNYIELVLLNNHSFLNLIKKILLFVVGYIPAFDMYFFKNLNYVFTNK